MNVVITGSNGYLVNRIKEQIEKEHNVICLSIRGDINIPQATDCIIHIAGLVPDRNNEESDYYKINTQKTKELCDMATAVGVKKFIYFSSMAVYGNLLTRKKRCGITLDSRIVPDSSYGDSKYQAEKYIKNSQSFSWTIIRLPSLYDQVEVNYFKPFINAVMKGTVPVCKKNTRRSLLHIDNLAVLLESIVNSDTYNNKIILPCDEYAPTVNDLFEKISRDMHIECKRSGIMGALWCILSYIHPYFCGFTGCAYYEEEGATIVRGKSISDLKFDFS